MIITIIMPCSMTTKPRSPGKTAISVSMTQSLLDQVDERATALNLTRSQYIAQLARADVATGGDLTLRESTSEDGGKPPKSPGSAAPKVVGSRELTKFPQLPKSNQRGKTAG